MPKINMNDVVTIYGSSYPPPFDQPCEARESERLGDAAGLTRIGVNMIRLPPGAWSSQRHWHIAEDEFLYLLPLDEKNTSTVAGYARQVFRRIHVGYCSDTETEISQLTTPPLNWRN